MSRSRAATIAVLSFLLVVIAGCELLSPSSDELDPIPPVRAVEGVTTDVAAIVGTFPAGPVGHPYLLESLAEFTDYYGGVDPAHEASFHVRAFFQNGGERIWVVRTETATEAGLLGTGRAGGGIAALADANRFNLLLVPEIFTSPQVPDRAYAAAQAIAYAASREAMMLLDPPAEADSAQGVIDWVDGSSANLRDPHGALFYGRIAVREDADAGTTRWIGASGAAAGRYAYGDRENGVWTAPAGTNVPALAGVLGTEPLSTDERSALTVAQIIPLIDGPVRLWGARTLAPDASEFTYVNVQRLTLYLDALVRERLAWTAGETMGQDLWDRVEADVEELLYGLWQDGAFQGMTPEQGYFVRSDASMHSDDDLASGTLRVQVGYAPLRAEEFFVRSFRFRV